MQMPAPAAPDARAAEILERIKGVFAARGFDGASMQDLARAAGMSAGNFYRYFPSKAAIIEAMVMRDLATMEGDFARIMLAPSPQAALRAAIWRHMTEVAGADGALWAEIEAAAARRPEIGAIRLRFYAAIRANLLRVLARIAAVTEEAAAARFGPEADLLMLLIRGAAVDGCGRCAGTSTAHAGALHALVMRHADMILAGVADEATFPPACPPAACQADVPE